MYMSPSAIEPEVVFSGRRSATYRDALHLFPDVWRDDIDLMRRFLHPLTGKRVLEIGAGNGHFSRAIAEDLGPTGLLVATDPSTEQLDDLEAEAGGRIKVFGQAAHTLDLPIRNFDAAWSRGAVHHISDKTAAWKAVAAHMQPGGRFVIADIFAGTRLAAYFDDFIARSCCTGHEVAFLSREFATSLCALTGWEEPRFTDVTTRWRFRTKADLGHFLWLLFSATEAFSDDDCLMAAERHLDVVADGKGIALLWPMTVMETTRLPIRN
jgi:SAM-dependent methyltransferase